MLGEREIKLVYHEPKESDLQVFIVLLTSQEGYYANSLIENAVYCLNIITSRVYVSLPAQ